MSGLGREVGPQLIDGVIAGSSDFESERAATDFPIEDVTSASVVLASVPFRRSGVDYVGSGAENGTEPYPHPPTDEFTEWMASLPA